MRKIIAICGAKGSGKTTLASFLQTHYRFERRSFAQPIRDALAAMGCPLRHLQPGADKSAPIPELANRTFRELAQTLGTEWGRGMVSEDLWIQIEAARLPRCGLFVYDDLRMQNEAFWLRSVGATIIKITGGKSTEGDPHPTEQGWREIDADLILPNPPACSSEVDDLMLRASTELMGFKPMYWEDRQAA